jgi:hypothetical protein
MPTNGELQRLGEVAMWFGNLELWVGMAIWQLAAKSDDDLQPFLQAITVEMSFDRKVHAFVSLFKLRFPDQSENEDLKNLVSDLFDAQSKRNAVLHSAWSTSKTDGLQRLKGSAKAKHGLQWQVHPASEQELAAVSAEIAETGQKFGRFCIERIQTQLAGTAV